VFEGYRSGRLDLTKLISHRFTLEQAAEAIALASNPQPDSLKIVLKCSDVSKCSEVLKCSDV
jgi:L-iditol 2-dehydrogenase